MLVRTNLTDCRPGVSNTKLEISKELHICTLKRMTRGICKLVRLAIYMVERGPGEAHY